MVVWGGGGSRIERDPNPIAFLPVPDYFLHFLHSPRLTGASLSKSHLAIQTGSRFVCLRVLEKSEGSIAGRLMSAFQGEG